MSHQRTEQGQLNRDGSVSRRAVRMKINSRSKRRAGTKRWRGTAQENLSPRELLRRQLEKKV